MRIPLFFLGNLLRCLFSLLHQRIRSISASSSKKRIFSTFKLSAGYYGRRVRERERERERERRYAMMQQRLDFGNFLSYSFDAAAAAVWTVEIDFFLLVVGW